MRSAAKTRLLRLEPSRIKGLKPCLHGSDAHELGKICKPDLDRFCWIKADPSFEGLKQVLYEPKERIFIGITPPRLKNDYQLIRSVKVHGAGWFPADETPINSDLVAIIGGRGSGKSALGEMIAFAGGSKMFDGTQDISDSFLYKASKKSLVNTEPIAGTKVMLHWHQGPPSQATIPVALKHGLEDEKIQYLPQKFVERLCAPENTERLEEEIERVIFQRIDKSERLRASGFRELRNAATQPVQLKKSQVRKAIQSLNQSIASASNRISLKPEKVKEEILRRAELNELLKKTPEAPPESAGEVKQREDLLKTKEQLQGEISDLNAQVATINTIESRFEIMRGEIADFNAEVGQLLETAGLGIEKNKFMLSIPTEPANILSRRKAELSETIRAKREGKPDEPELISLSTVEL